MKKNKRIKDREDIMTVETMEAVDDVSEEAENSISEEKVEMVEPLPEEEMTALEPEPEPEQVPAKSDISEMNKWLYKEFLNSPVLGEITRLYVENENKASLYNVIRAYIKAHKRDRDKIRVELAADRECYNGGGLKLLAMVLGILSVSGIVYALVSSNIELGMVFLTGAILSACVGALAARNTACRRMIEYVLGVFQAYEIHKK